MLRINKIYSYKNKLIIKALFFTHMTPSLIYTMEKYWERVTLVLTTSLILCERYAILDRYFLKIPSDWLNNLKSTQENCVVFNGDCWSKYDSLIFPLNCKDSKFLTVSYHRLHSKCCGKLMLYVIVPIK